MNVELMNKLKLSLDMRVAVLEAPDDSYKEALGVENAEPFSEMDAGTYDFVMLFVKDIASLTEHAPKALKAVKKDGLLWMCYPKGTARIKTDINRDRGWRVRQGRGLGRHSSCILRRNVVGHAFPSRRNGATER